MTTITTEQEQAIRDYLVGRTIPAGLGTAEEACSIAAINLVLSGKLTDEIPGCMSPVIGRWIIGTQDAMPAAMRNSDEWRDLLPLAAGTGRLHEAERLALLMGWMWATVLPRLQPLADEHGFGTEWLAMTTERTVLATGAAWAAAREAARAVTAATAVQAAWAAAREAARAVTAATAVQAEAAWAAATAVQAEAAWAAAAERAVVRAAEAASWDAARAAVRAAEAASWDAFDPCGLLRRMVEVGK